MFDELLAGVEISLGMLLVLVLVLVMMLVLVLGLFFCFCFFCFCFYFCFCFCLFLFLFLFLFLSVFVFVFFTNLHFNNINVVIKNTCHLFFLDFTHSPSGKEHKNVNIWLSSKTYEEEMVNGRKDSEK